MASNQKAKTRFVIFTLACLFGFSVFFIPQAPAAEGNLKMPGWSQKGRMQVFSPKTLYSYINGGADLYLKYDFQELKVLEYRNQDNASVTIEIYRHRTPDQAFGIYSQERPSEARFLNIGGQGYIEQMFLNFVSGPFYLKLSSDNLGQPEDVLLAFARQIIANSRMTGHLPPLLNAFPGEDKKENTEKFISKDFLGYSFFHSGFTANYESGGKKFQLFIIQGNNPKDAADMMKKYFQQIGRDAENIAEGNYRISDPYHKDIDLGWKGRYLWGVLNQDDPDLRAKYYRLLEEKMTAREK